MTSESTQRAIGTPVWFELATSDQDGSRRFYRELFGWEAVEHGIDGGGSYTVFHLDGHEVAACYRLTPEQLEQGVRPHWGVYFRVADCDDAAARVARGGGQIIVEPFDLADHLRMAVVADPDGAAFCLSQQRRHPGVGAFQRTGAVIWVELASADIARAEAFYGALLGWSFQGYAGDTTMPYRIISVAGSAFGGLLQVSAAADAAPAQWSIYVAVDDIDATVDKACRLGSQVLESGFDVPGAGRIARIADPGGAALQLIAPQG